MNKKLSLQNKKKTLTKGSLFQYQSSGHVRRTSRARVGHQRRGGAARQQLRRVRRVVRRARAPRVPARLRGGAPPRVRLGHAQHQQPQRAHPQEELPRRAGLLRQVPPARRLPRAPAPGDM